MALIENWKLVVLERYAKFDGRAGRGEFWWFVLANVLVNIVLGILYESFIHPLTILSGLPSAGVGALLMLILFNAELDLYGFVILRDC